MKVPDVPNVCEICGQPSQIATPEQYGEAIQEHFHKKEAGSLQALTSCSACFFLNAVRVCQRCERFLCMDCTFSHICRKVS